MISAFLCVLVGIAWWIGASFSFRDLLEPVSRDPEIMGRVFGVVVSMLALFGYEAERFSKAVGIKNPLLKYAVAYVIGVVGSFFSTLMYPVHPEGLRDVVVGSLSVKASFLMGFSEGAILYALFLFAVHLLLNLLKMLR
ncbi:MAG: hypothetical protein GXO18_03690 [Aquificae bacterium]|nr:hypothetical protein [Aquificota bacterium]